MNLQPKNREAYWLLHEGAKALAKIEQVGMRIDVDYCKRMYNRLGRLIQKAEDDLVADFKEIQEWKESHGSKFNLDSDTQLADLLFHKMGLTPIKFTKNDNESVGADALEYLDVDFVKPLVDYKRLVKAKGTYIAGILREQVDGYLHPFFNLNIVKSFRSSSSNINFQNQPVRVPLIKQIVRSAFLPRPGRRFGGLDYSGAEVKMSACQNQDPNMIKYVSDPTTDMHRDTAMDLYLVDNTKVNWKDKTPGRGKDIRFSAKNGFVFAEFYGDWWLSTGTFLWNMIGSMKLCLDDGTPLKEHLYDQGIKELGRYDEKTKTVTPKSFLAHVRDVEDIFWNERFKVYNQWKRDFYKQYEKTGYIDLLTGFRCQGVMDRKQVCNYPIQGPAFHWLLWSLIQMQKWIEAEKLESLIVGQIHDDMVWDWVDDEMKYILFKARDVMCVDIKEHWPWIIVPLEVEAEAGGIDESWFDKKVVEIPSSEPVLVPF